MSDIFVVRVANSDVTLWSNHCWKMSWS